MADNPIKYSEFVQPDSSITDLIAQLEKLEKVYVDMLKEVREEAKKTEDALKGVKGTTEENQETTKKAVTDAERLKKANDDLNKSRSDNAKQIANLKRQQQEQNNINKLTAKLNAAAEGSYNRLSAQYALNKIRLNNMSKAQRETTESGKALEKQSKKIYEEMNRLQKATGKSQLQVGQYERGIGGMTQAFSGMPGPMGRVVTSFKMITTAARAFIATPVGIILAAFVAVGATIKKVITVSKDYEAQMDRVQAITGANAVEMDNLNESAKELGRTTTKTAKEVGSLQEEYAKLGFTTSEILDAAEATIALSEATGSDLAQSAKVAASTIRGFGLDAAETNRVVDVMAKSFSSSALDLGKFETAMAQVAPVAKVNNVSIEESTALLGTLSDAGLDASTAGTSLRNMYLELSKKGLTFNQALDKINTSQDKAGTSLELFGKRGAVAGLIIADNIEKTTELTDKLNNAGGAANEMAAIVRDNLNGDVQALSSAWEGLFLSMDDGNGVITKLSRWFVQALTKMITGLTNFKKIFAKEWNELIEGSTAFRVAIAAVESTYTWVFSNLLATTRIFINSLLGVGKIIKAALTGNLGEAKQGWEDIKDSFVNGFKEIKGNVVDVGTNIKKAYTGESIDKYIIKSEEVVDSLDEQTKAVNNYGDASVGAYAASAEAIEKERKAREKAEKDKQKLLFDTMEAGQQKELVALEKSYADKKILFQKYNLDLVTLEEWKTREQEKINKKYTDKELAEKEKFAKQQYEFSLNQLDQEYDLRLSEIDIMKATEAEKTRLRLQAEKERLQAILELNKKGNGDLSKEQVQAVQNTIKNIDQEMTASVDEDQDIYSMVGLNLDDEKKEAINTSTQYAIGAVNAFLQAKIDAANASVEAANTEADAAQSAVDAEIEAKNNGYASNVAVAQKELALAKKNQQKALKDQEKAQKAQAAIETLQQIGSLVTASAKIWGQLGFPWAIPAIAVMFGSFAFAKIKAAQATKQKKFATGGLEILGGGSHASGNDTVIGHNNGHELRGEKDEALAVINKHKTRKYKNILPGIIKSLNKGNFEKKYGSAYDLGGLSLSTVSNNVDIKNLENDVRDIKKQGERRYFVDGKGRVIETYKNLRRIYNAN